MTQTIAGCIFDLSTQIPPPLYNSTYLAIHSKQQLHMLETHFQTSNNKKTEIPKEAKSYIYQSQCSILSSENAKRSYCSHVFFSTFLLSPAFLANETLSIKYILIICIIFCHHNLELHHTKWHWHAYYFFIKSPAK